MNDNVHRIGFSIPLASSNIGQLGLWHRLNTNTVTSYAMTKEARTKQVPTPKNICTK